MSKTVLTDYNSFFRGLVLFSKKAKIEKKKRRFHRTFMFHRLDFTFLNNLLQLYHNVLYKSDSGTIGMQSSNMWSFVL